MFLQSMMEQIGPRVQTYNTNAFEFIFDTVVLIKRMYKYVINIVVNNILSV